MGTLDWTLMLLAIAGAECLCDAPREARVLWRPPFADWRLAKPPLLGGRLFLWYYAIGSQVIVLSPTTRSADVDEATHERFLALTDRLPTRIFGVLGAALTWAICLALPLLALRLGVSGFALSACLTVNLWLFLTIVASLYVHHVETALRGPTARGNVLLGSPLGIWARTGAIADRLVRPFDASRVLWASLSQEQMVALLRPAWYDRQANLTVEQHFEQQLLARMDPTLTEQLFRPPPRMQDGTSKYCPRCGACFHAVATCCSDCPGGITLVSQSGPHRPKDSSSA